MICSLVVKLSKWRGKSMSDLALLSVTPALTTCSIWYWACSEGRRVAVIGAMRTGGVDTGCPS